MEMALVVLALLAGAVVSASGEQNTVTPIEKVITLLEDLKAEVESEGSGEAATYDEFACFCKDTTAQKSEAITTGQDTIDQLSAEIEAKTAEKAELLTEVEELELVDVLVDDVEEEVEVDELDEVDVDVEQLPHLPPALP